MYRVRERAREGGSERDVCIAYKLSSSYTTHHTTRTTPHTTTRRTTSLT